MRLHAINLWYHFDHVTGPPSQCHQDSTKLHSPQFYKHKVIAGWHGVLMMCVVCLHRLENGGMYYFEFFEKAYDGAIVTEVKVRGHSTLWAEFTSSVHLSGRFLEHPTTHPYLQAPLPWPYNVCHMCVLIAYLYGLTLRWVC